MNALWIATALQAEQEQADSRRTVAAFVTFREEAGKAACLRAQPRSRMRQWLALSKEHKLRGRRAGRRAGLVARLGWGARPGPRRPPFARARLTTCNQQNPLRPSRAEAKLPAHPRLNGKRNQKRAPALRRHALAISDAPEPSDVKYENIEHGAAARGARRVLTAALQYASLAVGFALISAASAMRFNQAGILGVDRGACNRSCDFKVGPAGRTALNPWLVHSLTAPASPLPGGVRASLTAMATGGPPPPFSPQRRYSSCPTRGAAASPLAPKSPNPRPAARKGAAGVLSLSDANRQLYHTCASTTRRPDGSPCSGEAACYKCYCFEAIGAGMIGWGAGLGWLAGV
jgi:hypothetical protein